MFASVSLEGTKYGVITDVSGFYSLSKVPEGEYYLVVSSIEYKNVKEKIQVVNGKMLTKSYLLEASVGKLTSFRSFKFFQDSSQQAIKEANYIFVEALRFRTKFCSME